MTEWDDAFSKGKHWLVNCDNYDGYVATYNHTKPCGDNNNLVPATLPPYFAKFIDQLLTRIQKGKGVNVADSHRR